MQPSAWSRNGRVIISVPAIEVVKPRRFYFYYGRYLKDDDVYICRVYAEVYHVKGAYQLKANDQFLPLRKSEELQKFFNDVYSKTDVDPKDIEYVEANGAGNYIYYL